MYNTRKRWNTIRTRNAKAKANPRNGYDERAKLRRNYWEIIVGTLIYTRIK